MYKFVELLNSNNIDVIGDVHGEYDALLKLINCLGYDLQGNHKNNNKLVFVGDLVDRGPDSVSVVKLVKSLVDNGNAQCILGNHELDILLNLQRDGNGWFFESPHIDDIHKKFKSVKALDEDKQLIIKFFKSLPIALENDKLRIVHACWHQESIDELQSSNFKSVIDAHIHYTDATSVFMRSSGLQEKYDNIINQYHNDLISESSKVPYINDIAEYELEIGSRNPIKILTSGVKEKVNKPFFAGGKWRMLDRCKWWDVYTDYYKSVIIGHYWRTFKSNKDKSEYDLFKNIEFNAWHGYNNNVFCVDYSVGRRYNDRLNNKQFINKLAAFRVQENKLITEDGEIYNV